MFKTRGRDIADDVERKGLAIIDKEAGAAEEETAGRGFGGIGHLHEIAAWIHRHGIGAGTVGNCGFVVEAAIPAGCQADAGNGIARGCQ